MAKCIKMIQVCQLYFKQKTNKSCNVRFLQSLTVLARMFSILADCSTTPLLVATFVFTAVYVYLNRRWKHSTKSHLPRPPGLPSLPVVGSLPFLSGKDPTEFFLKKSKELGKVFSLHAASRYIKLLINEHVYYVINDRKSKNKTDR